MNRLLLISLIALFSMPLFGSQADAKRGHAQSFAGSPLSLTSRGADLERKARDAKSFQGDMKRDQAERAEQEQTGRHTGFSQSRPRGKSDTSLEQESLFARFFGDSDSSRRLPEQRSEQDRKSRNDKDKRLKRAEKEMPEAEMYILLVDQPLVEQAMRTCPMAVSELVEELVMSSPKNLARYYLLIGPPGTGKTTLARAIGQVVGRDCLVVPSSLISNEFKNSGTRNTKNLIEKIMREYAADKPCIVAIDEIQLLNRKRDKSQSDDYGMIETLWMMLEKYGHKNLLVIGIANFDDKEFPEALVSRFDEVIYMPLPNQAQREAIIRYFMNERPGAFAAEVTPEKLADKKITGGLSARNIELAIKKAARRATVKQKLITLEDCTKAIKLIKDGYRLLKENLKKSPEEEGLEIQRKQLALQEQMFRAQTDPRHAGRTLAASVVGLGHGIVQSAAHLATPQGSFHHLVSEPLRAALAGPSASE